MIRTTQFIHRIEIHTGAASYDDMVNVLKRIAYEIENGKKEGRDWEIKKEEY